MADTSTAGCRQGKSATVWIKQVSESINLHVGGIFCSADTLLEARQRAIEILVETRRKDKLVMQHILNDIIDEYPLNEDKRLGYDENGRVEFD